MRKQQSGSPLSPSPIHAEVLSFLLGSLATAIAGQFLDRSLTLFPALLSAGLLIVAAWNILYTRNVGSRIAKLLEDNLVSVQYIHEPFDPAKGFKPTGHIHGTLADLVSKARCQILVFAVHWDASNQKFEGLDTKQRQNYFEAIEKKLREKAGDGFDYTRIIQVPPGREHDDLSVVLDPATYAHCARLAQIALEYQGRPGYRIRFFRTTQRMAGGFMLVDQRHLSLGLDGSSVSSTPCFSAHLLIEDRGGSFVRDWRLHFGDLQDSAKAVNADAFLQGQPPKSPGLLT